MANALYIPVKESKQQLRKLLKQAKPIERPRLVMLIEMKKVGKSGISKRALVDLVGVSGQSIHSWRTNYKKGGIKKLLSHNKGGYKPCSFSTKEIKKLGQLMHTPENHIKGYKELQHWVKKEFNKQIKYNTLLKFMVATFQTKIKVARKSHIKKDAGAVQSFKKNLVKSVKKPPIG